MEQTQAAQFKETKQRLSIQQTAISKVLKQGKLPLPEDVAAFADNSRKMAQLGDPAWSAAMTHYIEQVAALENAMAADNPEEIRRAFEVLNERKLSCHKEFRTGH